MNYTSIDPIITEWIGRNHLNLYTKYQDTEVRAARLSDAQGRIYAIGIESPDKEGRIKVRANAWDFKRRNKEYTTTPQKLADTLEDALLVVRKWMQK
jgi:major membrane immunogen (membrane-anchored lipoprotein)